MDQIAASDVGLFAMRVSIAYVYLYAGWMISRTSEKRRQTAIRTAVLLDGTPIAGNAAAATALAFAGFVLIYAGSLGLVLGIATRWAAAMLIVFSVPGTVIHLRERDQALGLVEELRPHAGAAAATLVERLQVSSYAAHQSSANKNYALIGACAFLMLAEDPNGAIALAGLI